MEKTVGILGCGGLIGRAACRRLLDRGMKVTGGQRHNISFESHDDLFRWKYTDIYDDKSLAAFCDANDIILNCAGPSYRIKGRVAEAAAASGDIYVDLADLVMTDPDIRGSLPEDGTYVIGTGYVPGASGIFLNTAAADFDHIDKVQGFQAGRQRYSATAFEDILMSSLSDAGFPDSYYENGKIVRDVNEYGEKKLLPAMPEAVYIKPYLTRELRDCAEKANIKELHWYNALPDKKMKDMIFDAYRQAAISDAGHAVEKIRERSDSFFEKISPEDNWSMLLFEIIGSSNGSPLRHRYVFSISDSNTLCGYIAAETVIRLVADPPALGSYWAKDICKYKNMDELCGSMAGASADVVDIAHDSPDIFQDEMESDFI